MQHFRHSLKLQTLFPLPILVRHATDMDHPSFDRLPCVGGWFKFLIVLSSLIDFRTKNSSTALLTSVDDLAGF